MNFQRNLPHKLQRLIFWSVSLLVEFLVFCSVNVLENLLEQASAFVSKVSVSVKWTGQSPNSPSVSLQASLQIRFQSLYTNVFSLCREAVLAGGREAKGQVTSLEINRQVASPALGGSSSTRRKVPPMGIGLGLDCLICCLDCPICGFDCLIIWP